MGIIPESTQTHRVVQGTTFCKLKNRLYCILCDVHKEGGGCDLGFMEGGMNHVK